MNDRAQFTDREMVDHDLDQALSAAAEHRANESDISLLAWAAGRPSPIPKKQRPVPQWDGVSDPF